MTLVALTQEPEVKVRLAMIGKWCLPHCIALHETSQDYSDAYCALYSETELVFDYDAPGAAGHLRCPACIAAHGGAE